MRIFLQISVVFIIISLFSGCVQSNAFSRFDFNEIKERATSSLRTSKIADGNQIYGVISSIYLNEVIPQKYNGMEYFYVTIYTKDRAKLYDPNILEERDLVLLLNGKSPVKIKKIDQNNNIFKGLIPINNDWNSYYLVAFDKDMSENLSLILKSGSFGSQALTYQKGEQ